MNLAVLALLCLQETTALDTLKKIEETIQSAKSIRIKYEFEETRGVNESIKASGTMLLKGANQLVCTVPNQGVEGVRTFACDGVALKNQRNRNQRKAPKNLRKLTEASMIRGLGMYWTIINISELADGPDTGPEAIEKLDAEKLFSVSEATNGKDDQGRPFVTFKVKKQNDEAGIVVKFWYDAKTYALIKRVIRFEGEGREGRSITEAYTEYSLGEDIPDETFKLTPSE